MDAIAEVERLISPSIDDLGYELVRVQLSGDGAPTLQIMAERKDRGDMTVEDCAEISRLVSALLDVEDPLPGAYTLEVSSPGLDRPLMRIGDYDRFAGYEARVETRRLIDGRKRFRGRLSGIRGDAIVIDCTSKDGETDEHVIAFADVLRGKLLLSDELIAAAMKGQSR